MIRGCLNKASKVYSFKGLPNFEIGIVHPTLALEGSLRHTASAPEQVNDLVEQGVKVHFPSPQPVRKGPSLSEGTSYQNPAEGATMRTITARMLCCFNMDMLDALYALPSTCLTLNHSEQANSR